MIVIKLGGSSITYKKEDSLPPYLPNELSRTYRVKERAIHRIGSLLSDFKEERLIIIHGGGTHGHRTVNRWRMGIRKGTEQMMAWEVKWRMDQLTGIVIKTLGGEKVPVVSVPTSTITLSDQGEVVGLSYSPIKWILERGSIPVLRGDMVPDVNGGWSVISGDTLIQELCKNGKEELEPVSKVVMILDVEGFLDPENGELIRDIDRTIFLSNREKWEKLLVKNPGDVSGGIWGKVRTCYGSAAMGVESFMIGSENIEGLNEILHGGNAGTRFIPFQEQVLKEDP